MKKNNTIVVGIDAANSNAVLQARNAFTASRTLPAKVDALTAAAFFAANYQGATALIREGLEKAINGDDVFGFENAVDLLIKVENTGDNDVTRLARIDVIAAILTESKKFHSAGGVKNIFRHVFDEHNTASAALDAF